jgi:spermidine synthase
MPNHLSIKTGSQTLSYSMRRLLTGYVVNFTRRHKPYGHLFQNRYKSILCEDGPYLLELSRYIHLNPLKANMVKNMQQEKIILSHVITSQGELQLQQWVETDEKNQPVYEIIFNGVFLMASYNEIPEKELATLAIEPLASERHDLRLLVGGLGIGYTLHAALNCDRIQAVDVVEIEQYIIRWATSFFSELNGYACFDSRVCLITMDLGDYICKTGKTYDAIILDVDNGPTWLALESNQRLYQRPTLLKMKELLRDGGVFTVWSAQKCPAFHKRLGEIFGRTELITVQDIDRRGLSTDYFIYRTRSC